MSRRFQVGLSLFLLMMITMPAYGGSALSPALSLQSTVSTGRDANFILTAQNRSSSLVTRIQEKLAQLGYRPGKADGVMGRRTRTAIMAFQRDRGLPISGRANEILLDQLENALGRTSGKPGPSASADGSSRPKTVQSFSSAPVLEYDALLSLLVSTHPELFDDADFATAYFQFINPYRAECKNISFEEIGDLWYLEVKEKALKYAPQAIAQIGDNPPNIFRFRLMGKLKRYDLNQNSFPLEFVPDGTEKEVYQTQRRGSCTSYKLSERKLPNRFFLRMYGGDALTALPMSRDRALTYTRNNHHWESITIESLVHIGRPDPEGHVDVKILGARAFDYRGALLHVFDEKIFRYLDRQKKSATRHEPLTPCMLVYHLINSFPEELTQEIIITNTTDEIKFAQDRSSGNGESSPIFEYGMVKDRDPEFAAHDFFGQFYEKAVREKAASMPKKVWIQQDLELDKYDYERKVFLLKKQYTQPWNDTKAEILTMLDHNDQERENLPEEVQNLHLYKLPEALPSFDDCSYGFYSLNRRSRKYSSFALVWNSILASDRLLQLEGLPMEPREAEKLFVKLKKGEDLHLRARISIQIQKLIKVNNQHDLVVVAAVEKVEILKPGDVLFKSYNKEEFESAIEHHQPTFNPTDEVTGQKNFLYFNSEFFDLLITKHHPMHLNSAIVERLLLDQWQKERADKNTSGPKIFKGANKPSQDDLAGMKRSFWEWYLEEAQKVGDTFTIKLTGENTKPGFDPDQLQKGVSGDNAGLAGFISGEELFKINTVHSDGYGEEYLQWFGFGFGEEQRTWGNLVQYFLHLTSKVPVPSSDILPVCDSADCPPYGAEWDVKISRIIYNEGKDDWSAFILEGQVVKARYYEIADKKKFKEDFFYKQYRSLENINQFEFGRLLSEVETTQP